jgi:hypothetical protein
MVKLSEENSLGLACEIEGNYIDRYGKSAFIFL